MRNRLVSFAGAVSIFTGRCCGVFYIAAASLSVAEVFMRYALDAPTTWASECIMALCASAWMLSAGAVTYRQRHIAVTALGTIVSGRARRILSRIAGAIAILAIAGLIVACWEPMLSSLNSVQRSGSAFNPPTPTYVKTLLVFSCALYLLQLFANLAKDWHGNEE